MSSEGRARQLFQRVHLDFFQQSMAYNRHYYTLIVKDKFSRYLFCWTIVSRSKAFDILINFENKVRLSQTYQVRPTPLTCLSSHVTYRGHIQGQLQCTLFFFSSLFSLFSLLSQLIVEYTFYPPISPLIQAQLQIRVLVLLELSYQNKLTNPSRDRV